MARSAASCGEAVLHTPSGVLHKNAFSDEALFRFTPQYEASSFHSDMKHSAYAPYDLKMKNESCVCKYSLSMLFYSIVMKRLSMKNKPFKYCNGKTNLIRQTIRIL